MERIKLMGKKEIKIDKCNVRAKQTGIEEKQ
jgi:hypothetical protein